MGIDLPRLKGRDRQSAGHPLYLSDRQPGGPDDVGRPGTGVEQPHDLALGLVHPVVSDRAAGAALVTQVAHDGLRRVTMTIGSPHPAHPAVMWPTCTASPGPSGTRLSPPRTKAGYEAHR